MRNVLSERHSQARHGHGTMGWDHAIPTRGVGQALGVKIQQISDAVFKGKSSVQCCGRAQVRTLMSCDHHKSTLDRNWLDIHVILTEAGAGLG